MSDAPDVLIVGGGISGLSAAVCLVKKGLKVTLLEAGERAGGLIQTLSDQDYVIECGPHTFPTTAESVQAICHMVGIQPVATHKAAKKRYLYLKGRLCALPHDPLSALWSPVLSLKGKLAVMEEPFRPPLEDTDMSIADFMSARLGQEALENLVDPFVSGIYAGDVQALSMAAVFPKLWDAQQKSGSLIKGLRAKRPHRSPARARYALQSVPGGLGKLVAAMAAVLPRESLRLHTAVTHIQRTEAGFLVQAENGEMLQSKGLILALPADRAAHLLQAELPVAAEALAAIPYNGLCVVHTAFRKLDLDQRMDGFGFLVPRKEGMPLLGSIWASSLFNDRCPSDQVLLANFIGGAHAPETTGWDEETIAAQVLGDLRTVFREPLLAPLYSRVLRYERAIPQATLGHQDRIRTTLEAVATVPGLALAGNYLSGVSLNDCVASGQKAAEAMRAL